MRAEVEVGVEAPAEARVETLGPVDVSRPGSWPITSSFMSIVPGAGVAVEASVLTSVLLMRSSLDRVGVVAARVPLAPVRSLVLALGPGT